MDGGTSSSGGGCSFGLVVRWGNVIIGVANAGAGAFAFIWQFLPFGALFTPLTFIVYIYITAFGTFLTMAELNRPDCFMRFCDFVRGRIYRGIFVGLLSTLTLTAGFTGNKSSASNIILLVVGFATLAFSFLTCIFGRYIEEDEEDSVPVQLPFRGGSQKEPSRGANSNRQNDTGGQGETEFTSQI